MKTDRLMRIGEVMERTGRSRTSLYRDFKGGRFPQPVRIGIRAIAWRESDVEEWLANLSTERPPQDLHRFAREICRKHIFEGFYIDGGDLQDLAEKCGVIVGHEMTEPCNKGMEEEARCVCVEEAGPDCFPLTCYQLAENLKEEA